MRANLVFKTDEDKNTIVLNFTDNNVSVVCEDANNSNDIDVVELQNKIETSLQEFLEKKGV